MDSYDSDSSGIDEELDDYTETGVLLGYASKEELSDAISHLGGWPVSVPFFLQSRHHIWLFTPENRYLKTLRVKCQNFAPIIPFNANGSFVLVRHGLTPRPLHQGISPNARSAMTRCRFFCNSMAIYQNTLRTMRDGYIYSVA